MHVRVAWEIYHHQAKQNPEKASSVAGVKPESMLRPHMYPPHSSPSVPRPHDMPSSPAGFTNPNSLPSRSFDQLTANFLSSPSSHMGLSSDTFKLTEFLIKHFLQEFLHLDVMLHRLHHHLVVYLLTLEICLWEGQSMTLGEGNKNDFKFSYVVSSEF